MRRGILLALVVAGLLVVALGVGMVALIGVTAVATQGAMEEARVDMAEMEVRRLEERVEIWRLRRRDGPDSVDDISDAPGARDPWGRPYRLEPDGDVLSVVSDGPDGAPGTTDDVRSRGVR